MLERLVALLEAEFGDDLRAVWLYGSRARGDTPSEDSDVDLLVVSRRSSGDDHLRAIELVSEAASGEGENASRFSLKLYSPERVAERRAIRSFFMQEVDRDKIVLSGNP